MNAPLSVLGCCNRTKQQGNRLSLSNMGELEALRFWRAAAPHVSCVAAVQHQEINDGRIIKFSASGIIAAGLYTRKAGAEQFGA